MEAQNPASNTARSADAGMGLMCEGSPPIGLDLGLGSRLTHGGKSGFTFLQLQELEHQALIFKYMAAGAPVPSHLILPIWKSFVSSYGGTEMISPTFLGYRGLCLDYRNNMEPEPGRCRRTDGKKWRCSKDVVPDQKYCERHMHRGRNRSRKHVETASQITASSNNLNDPNINLSISINNNNVSPPILGFSPKSVLQSGACKTESS